MIYFDGDILLLDGNNLGLIFKREKDVSKNKHLENIIIKKLQEKIFRKYYI